jgi:hypothetical protein
VRIRENVTGIYSETGTVPVRNEPKTGTPDMDTTPPNVYTFNQLARIERNLGAIARKISDRTKPVDEYEVNAVYSAAESLTTVEVLPQFEISELITSVLVTGPPSTAFTLMLGDRQFGLLTDASGKLTLAPVGFLLDRSMRRVLTSATAGNWTLELMGHADARY